MEEHLKGSRKAEAGAAQLGFRGLPLMTDSSLLYLVGPERHVAAPMELHPCALCISQAIMSYSPSRGQNRHFASEPTTRQHGSLIFLGKYWLSDAGRTAGGNWQAKLQLDSESTRSARASGCGR